VEWQLAPNLRFFLQVTTAIGVAEGTNLSLQGSFCYGYKLTLAEDLKLELSSSAGYPNYFQLAIVNSKFRAALPMVTSEGSAARF
jgi:hypothetical protein